jgi:hypothetical protein
LLKISSLVRILFVATVQSLVFKTCRDEKETIDGNVAVAMWPL